MQAMWKSSSDPASFYKRGEKDVINIVQEAFEPEDERSKSVYLVSGGTLPKLEFHDHNCQSAE